MLKKVSYFTHQGPFLNLNEDTLDSDIDLNLYTVLDGFGGGGIGDVSSQLAKETLKNCFTKISSDEDSTMPFVYSSRYLLETNALLNAFHQAHQAIMLANQNKNLSMRGGVSCCAVALSGNLATIVNCGNTTVYLKRGHSFSQIIASDSFENLTSVAPEQKNLTTLPAMALGLFTEIDLHVVEFLPQKNDILLLATDGLVSMVDHKNFVELFNSNDDDLVVLQNIAELNNGFGNWDNQSGIVLRF